MHFVRKHFPRLALTAHFYSLLYATRYLTAESPSDFTIALKGWVAGVRGEVGPPASLTDGPFTHSKTSSPSGIDRK